MADALRLSLYTTLLNSYWDDFAPYPSVEHAQRYIHVGMFEPSQRLIKLVFLLLQPECKLRLKRLLLVLALPDSLSAVSQTEEETRHICVITVNGAHIKFSKDFVVTAFALMR